MQGDYDVLIRSGDRDSFQLVNDRTTVIYPMRGVSEMKRMTPAAVEERYGVPPQRYPELAAIVGETSDKIPGKKGEALREHLGDVMRNRQLNALVCDLDLPLKPEDLAVRPWDRQEV